MNTFQNKGFILLLVIIFVQGFSLVGIVSRGNRDFIGNIVGTTIFWLAFTVCEYIYKLRINYYIRLAVVISIIGDGFFGFYCNLYALSPFFDRIQHMFAAYALALFFYAIIMCFMESTMKVRWVTFIFVTAIGMAAGSFYEILEFAVDTMMKPQILNQPSLQDTDLDLLSNTVGSVIAGFHSMYIRVSGQGNPPSMKARNS
ncbi:MAG: hypothetical protein K0Q53_735 [Massilibacillus sp.]|jgi:hypothetical protein|nr:hypothetical protein [Massilibacillus sp.]